jgi:hypothetical protein
MADSAQIPNFGKWREKRHQKQISENPKSTSHPRNAQSHVLDLGTGAAHFFFVVHFFFDTMKVAVGALLIATVSAFTATSLQNARAIGAVKSAPVAIAPSVRLFQT